MEVQELADIFNRATEENNRSHSSLFTKLERSDLRLTAMERSTDVVAERMNSIIDNGGEGELTKVKRSVSGIRKRIESLEKRWYVVIGLAGGSGLGLARVIDGIRAFIQAGG
jgi:hypothetical protein